MGLVGRGLRAKGVLLLLWAGGACGYGEGHGIVERPWAGGSVEFVDDDCAVIEKHSWVSGVRVSLDGERCVDVSLRCDTALAWYFVVPPLPDSITRHCGEGIIQIALELPRKHADLYCLASAWLVPDLKKQGSNASEGESGRDSEDAPLLSAASTVFVVKEAPWIDSSSRLREAYEAARADGEEERAAYHERVGNISMDHSALATLEPWLDNELYAALLDGTPSALRRVVTGGRVGVFKLFSDSATKRLARLVDEADLRGGTNTVNVYVKNTTDDEPPSSSMLLDEMGIGPLAEALVEAVLAPLSMLLFPEFASEPMDSYHAFTIHKRAAPFMANTSRATAHNDVCEVSLNVAVRVSDLQGSRVAFYSDDSEEWLGHTAGGAFINVCRDRHGVEPTVSGGRDTFVIRGFSSALRRAPAETFFRRCVR